MISVRPVTVTVDNGAPLQGELRVERHQEVVHTAGGTYKPNPKWSHVDSNGHFHAFAEDKALPTLKPVTTCECDCVSISGCTADYCSAVTTQHCRGCDEAVEPDFVRDYEPVVMSGPTTYEVLVYADLPPDRGVPVRVVTSSGVWFGFARVVSREAHGSGGDVRVRSLIVSGALHRQLDSGKEGAR